MKQWFFSWFGSKWHEPPISQDRIPRSYYSKYTKFEKLPSSLWELDESYQNLMRELSKR